MMFARLERRALKRVNQAILACGGQPWPELPPGTPREGSTCVFARAFQVIDSQAEVGIYGVSFADGITACNVAQAWRRRPYRHGQSWVVAMPLAINCLRELFDMGLCPHLDSSNVIADSPKTANPAQSGRLVIKAQTAEELLFERLETEFMDPV